MRIPRGLVVAVVMLVGVSTRGAELEPLERQRLVSHLEMTASWLADEVSGLSQAQREFRPDPASWTIMEVVDHLVVVGQIYWDDLQHAIRRPAASRDLSTRDADILWYGIDRTHRERAIPSENSRREMPDLTSALATYRTQHARLLNYIRTTKDDLRNRVVGRQGSDAYQWALLISTHEQRHILQIREIKAHPRYPRP